MRAFRTDTFSRYYFSLINPRLYAVCFLFLDNTSKMTAAVNPRLYAVCFLFFDSTSKMTAANSTSPLMTLCRF